MGNPVNYLSLPIMANPDTDQRVGSDEMGNPFYRTVLGHQYTLESQNLGGRAETINALKSAASSAYENPLATAGAVAKAIPGAMWEGIQAPYNALQGRPVTHGNVLATAADWGAMGMGAAAPKGATRMFAGRNAKTADLNAMAKAEGMLADGIDRTQVLQDTGWFRGADGKMRFEIDDSAAVTQASGLERAGEFNADYAHYRSTNSKIKERLASGDITQEIASDMLDRNTAYLQRRTRESNIASNASRDLRNWGGLPEVMRHDELYSAYPMDTIRAKMDMDSSTSYQGSFEEGAFGSGYIGVRGNLSPQQSRSTLLHETQHAVQAREGFGRGSNLDVSNEGVVSSIRGEMRDLSDQISATQARLGLSGYQPKHDELTPLYQRYDDLMGARDAAFTPEARLDFYRRNSGEVEARNVQTRRDFSPELRIEKPPWATQDIPDADQIVRFGGGQQASYPEWTDAREQILQKYLSEVGG